MKILYAGLGGAGLTLSLLVAAPLAAQDYSDVRSAQFGQCMDAAGGVTADMLACIRSEFTRQDRELNRVYRDVRARLKTPALRTRLRDSQRAWIWRRDYDCQARADESGGGTAADLIYEDCRVTKTVERTEWLRKVPANPGYLTKV